MSSYEVEYKSNNKGFQAMMQDPAMSKAMVELGRPAVAYARQTAPKDTKVFSQSFDIQPQLVATGRRGTLRAGAAIINSAPYAYVVKEAGASKTFMNRLGKLMEGGNV